MASIYDFLPTEASNSTTGGVNAAEGMDPSAVNDASRAWKQLQARWLDDLGGVVTVGGTGDAQTVTLAEGMTALATGMVFGWKAPGANTGAAVVTVTNSAAAVIGTNKKIRRKGDTACSAGDMISGGFYLFRYDETADTAAGAFILLNPESTSTTFATNAQAVTGTSTVLAVNPANLLATRQLLNGVTFNLGLAASVGSNALTISLKGADGNDPSATNPVEIPFRNVTVTTGTPTVLSVTAATSVVVSSGSTLGTANGVATTLVVVGFNDAGTFRLGVINPLNLPVKDGIASSTAEGGAGGADTAGVYYTATAVTSKALTVLGWLTISEATAGTWATAHTAIGIGNAPTTAIQSQAGQLMAWVNFDGTGTPAIRKSGNVSSITDNGTGDYTVNFITAMPDANYGVAVTGSDATSGAKVAFVKDSAAAPTTSAVRVGFQNLTPTDADPPRAHVAVFR